MPNPNPFVTHGMGFLDFIIVFGQKLEKNRSPLGLVGSKLFIYEFRFDGIKQNEGIDFS